MLNKKKYICFTLDLEEDHAGLLKNNFEGLYYIEDFLETLKKNEIPLSVFLQAKLIHDAPDQIKLLKEYNCDIHLHSYSHSLHHVINKTIRHQDIDKSIKIFKKFFGKSPIGYRFPLGILNKSDYEFLHENGFLFDSSIFPTIRPGCYNNMDKPLTIYESEGIIEIPFSVISDLLRIPISLSYIKLFYPIHFLKKYAISPIIFDFHMHDLYNLKSTRKLKLINKLPYLRKSAKGKQIFFKFYTKLKREGYQPITMTTLYTKIKDENK